MKVFVYKCLKCNLVLEDENPSPPVCENDNDHGLMVRKYTPLNFTVRGGTPNHYGRTSSGRHVEELAEGEHQAKSLSDEIQRKDEEAKRNYVRGELHHKAGHDPDEPNSRKFIESGRTT